MQDKSAIKSEIMSNVLLEGVAKGKSTRNVGRKSN